MVGMTADELIVENISTFTRASGVAAVSFAIGLFGNSPDDLTKLTNDILAEGSILGLSLGTISARSSRDQEKLENGLFTLGTAMISYAAGRTISYLQ